MQQRQGDILIISVDELPEGIQEKEREDGLIVLAYGEVTGHKHAIADTELKWFGAVSGAQYLDASKPFQLRHEEHATLDFPPGKYRVVRQYEASADDVYQVMD